MFIREWVLDWTFGGANIFGTLLCSLCFPVVDDLTSRTALPGTMAFGVKEIVGTFPHSLCSLAETSLTPGFPVVHHFPFVSATIFGKVLALTVQTIL